jgi:phosphoribosylformimino-5-aminoimidazole carboxamide ribonucleotide (ProFAR) isomerase
VYEELLANVALPIVASGGVGTLDDLRSLDALAVNGRRIAGAIVGRALYEQRFTVAEAVDALRP